MNGVTPPQATFLHFQYSRLRDICISMKERQTFRFHRVFLFLKNKTEACTQASLSPPCRKYSCFCTAHCFSICETQCSLCSDNTASTHHVIHKRKTRYVMAQNRAKIDSRSYKLIRSGIITESRLTFYRSKRKHTGCCGMIEGSGCRSRNGGV